MKSEQSNTRRYMPTSVKAYSPRMNTTPAPVHCARQWNSTTDAWRARLSRYPTYLHTAAICHCDGPLLWAALAAAAHSRIWAPTAAASDHAQPRTLYCAAHRLRRGCERLLNAPFGDRRNVQILYPRG